VKSAPLVSILINNYNYAEFLGEAIESALNQRYRPFEVIVVDDGSTDNSQSMAASYGSRIQLIAKKNGGQASAFNAGFAASKGEVICFLDADDLFLPNKLNHVMEIFGDNPKAGWCFDTPEWFGASVGERYAGADVCKTGKVDAREMLSHGKAPYMPTTTSGLSFRRETLERILPMPEVLQLRSDNRITNDNYIKVAALSVAAGWLSSETVSMQRIHSDNAYTNLKAGKRRLFARSEVLTAICLSRNFPELRYLALQAVCRGLLTLCATGGIERELREPVFSYLRSAGPLASSRAFVKSAGMSAMRKLRRSQPGVMAAKKIGTTPVGDA
jgi:glycosyltransferase involved in cell wall biosynthesis